MCTLVLSVRYSPKYRTVGMKPQCNAVLAISNTTAKRSFVSGDKPIFIGTLRRNKKPKPAMISKSQRGDIILQFNSNRITNRNETRPRRRRVRRLCEKKRKRRIRFNCENSNYGENVSLTVLT